jgi:hypothetical protein
MGRRSIDVDSVVEYCQSALAHRREILLIEGVDGVMTPLDEHRTILDVMMALKLPLMLVTGSHRDTRGQGWDGQLSLRIEFYARWSRFGHAAGGVAQVPAKTKRQSEYHNLPRDVFNKIKKRLHPCHLPSPMRA